MLDLEDFGTLSHGYSSDKLSTLFRVNITTARRWKAGTIPAPHAVVLMLRFINWGELSSIGGPDWDGFTINMRDHKLNIPFFKKGFSPEEIKAMFFLTQDAWHDKRELRLTLEKLAATQAALDKSEQVNRFYRDQLRQAGREYAFQVLTVGHKEV